MGLDMYLIKETYVKNWDHSKNKFAVLVKLNGKLHPDVKPARITEITEEVMYWRKANHIHNWFVSNVQNGKDECQRSYVSNEQLKALLGVCKKVLKAKDDEVSTKLLPTSSGFFFGGTEYDEYYYQDIEDTIKVLKEELKSGVNGGYYYRASW